MKHNWVILLISNLLYLSTYSQNLVVNGDFEDFFSCPNTYTKRPYIPFVPGWKSPDEGTPDYFNVCSKLDAGVPFSWAGSNSAQSGNGYAGIYTYGKNYREYIITELNQSLTKGEKYYFSFYYLLASNSHICTDRIAARINYEDGESLLLKYIKDSALTEATGSWEWAADTIIATGREVSITIGNFDSDIHTKHFVIPYRGGKGELYENRAYYLIDNVRLTSASYPPIEHVDTLQTEILYTFKNVQFEFNSAELIPNTLTEIDQLASYLLSNSYHIIITGHTDEMGEVKYNQVLSESRAKSVAQYLISLGIGANRIQTEGKGESRPLVTEGNKKEMDAKNRRVEFVVRN